MTETINDLGSLPKQGDNAFDIFEFYKNVELSELVRMLYLVIEKWKESDGKPADLNFIEVPLLRAYARKINKSGQDPEYRLIKLCHIFDLNQINYVIAQLFKDYETVNRYSIYMGKMKARLWQELPKVYDSKEKIEKFFLNMSVECLVEYIQSVIDEWNLQWDDPIRDESVRSVELPLISAFANIAEESDIEKYSELLDEFQICDHQDAVNVARSLLGKEKIGFDGEPL